MQMKGMASHFISQSRSNTTDNDGGHISILLKLAR